MKFMPNPMARYEYKIARENRKIAEIDLRKTEVDKITEHGLADVVITRIVANAIKWVLLAVFLCITIASINDVFQNHDIQQQITNCERALTQADMDGDCSTGIIGEIPKEEK